MASLANFARGLADSLPTAQPQRDDATACQDNFVPALVLPWEYAHSAQLQQRYWLDQSRRHGGARPVDRGNNTVASTHRSTSLSVEETQLQEVPKAYNTQINDVLLGTGFANGRAIAL